MKRQYTKMSRSVVIPVDIYKRGVLIFIGGKEELFKRVGKATTEKIKEYLDEVDFDRTDAVTVKTEDVIIYAPQTIRIETLIHELSHATFHILKKVDIDPIKDEEAYAYLLEYLFFKAMKWLTSKNDGVP